VRMPHTKLWSWHIIASVVLLVLLGLHIAIMHLNDILNLAGFNPYGANPIDWENVAFRTKQLSFTIIYILVLAAGLFHGLYGTQTILFELNPSPRVRNWITGLFLIMGIGLLVLGTWAAIAGRTTALALTR